MAITPCNVTDFGTSRKPICDFLLVININFRLSFIELVARRLKIKKLNKQ